MMLPHQRQLERLENLATKLEEIVAIMQQVADFRQQKADDRYTELKSITDALEQQNDNTALDAKKLHQALENIHTKLHVISNHIMALGNSVDELAQYATLIDENQQQMQVKLNISSDE